MPKRPLAITIIGWLFIAAGTIGLLYHGTNASDDDLFWILLIRILAIVGGILMLRGSNSGRWLISVWMAYHLVLSFFHSITEIAMHAVLFGIIGYFLFRRTSSAYFRGAPMP